MSDERVVRKPELFSRIGLCDVTIWRMEKAGKFPKRITIGSNAVGWLNSEIEDWLAHRAADR